MNLAWTVERDDDVSLVRCRVHNDSAVPRRVRVESRLDGPVLPPRRAGVPEAGWDETGVTLRLEPDERRALGFAALAAPTEPPVAIVRSPAVDADGRQSGGGSEAIRSAGGTRSRPAERVSDALCDLAEHRPPRAAIAAGSETGDARYDRGARTDDTPDTEDGAANSITDESGCDDTGHEPPSRDAIDEWFDAVERRIERAERATDADLSTATDVVEAAGGIDAVAALERRVEADADRLREMSERASSLAARTEATDTPVEAMERLS